jgi:hypothetical protein
MLFRNIISSLGAFVSFFGGVIIMFIVWEALVSKRSVITVLVGYWDVEWGYEYPLGFHASNEVAKVYVWLKSIITFDFQSIVIKL